MSNVTSLSLFTIEGQNTTNGGSVSVPHGTVSVSVVTTLTDPNANVSAISGDTGLITGDNTLSFTVTAEDGTTVENYSVTVRVLNNVTSLSTYTIDTVSVVGLTSYDVSYGTTSVTFEVTPTDSNASVAFTSGTVSAIVGQPGKYTATVATGNNIIDFTVTAQDGVTTQNYTMNVVVDLSNITSLSTYTIDTVSVVGLTSYDVSYGTTSVTVEVTPSDANATVAFASGTEIVGQPGKYTVPVVPGSNTIEFTVTAQDGVATTDYSINVIVDANYDTSLSTYTIDTVSMVGLTSYDVSYGTTSVTIEVTPTDSNATVAFTSEFVSPIIDQPGKYTATLVPGTNVVAFTVTAQDGVATTDYSIDVIVDANNDNSLSIYTINDISVVGLTSYDLSYGTTSVTLQATPNDSNASVAFTSGTVSPIVDQPGKYTVTLIPGTNTVAFTVTAQDGVATQNYTIDVIVDANYDTSLSTYTIDAVSVVGLTTYDVYNGTTSITLEVTPTDSNATVAFTSGTVSAIVGQPGKYTAPLVIGTNTIAFTVTAQDGVTTQDYTIDVIAHANNDASLSTYTIDTVSAVGMTSYDVSYGTTSVTLEVTPTDSNSSVVFTSGTVSAIVDQPGKYTVTLVPGTNTVAFTVTAQDGVTTQDYTIDVIVRANNDTSLSTYTINTVSVVGLSMYDVSYGTTSVTIEVTPTDSNAVLLFSSSSVSEIVDQPGKYTATLVPGTNTVEFTVTAQDGVATRNYAIDVIVDANNSTTLSTYTIDNVSVLGLTSYDLSYGTTSATLEVTPTDPNASVVFTNGSVSEIVDQPGKYTVTLVPGTNTVAFTVTAQDGVATRNYTIDFVVNGNNDASLSAYTINTVSVVGLTSYDLSYGTTSVTLEVTPTDSNASVAFTSGSVSEIVGQPGKYTVTLVPGTNTVAFTVTAQDGVATQNYTIDVIVDANNDASLSAYTINTISVVGLTSYDLSYGTTSVTLEVTPTDSNASVAFTSGTVSAIVGQPGKYTASLVPGNNIVAFTVTAQDGVATQNYTIDVIVDANNDTSLSTYTINTVSVVGLTSYDLSYGTTSVTLEVTPTDSNSSVVFTSGTVSAIVGQPGKYTVTVALGSNPIAFTVTAPDGVATQNYTIDVIVDANNDTSLSTYKINNVSVVGLSRYDVSYGTTSVTLEVTPTDSNASVAFTSGTVSAIVGQPGKYTATVTLGNNPVSFRVTAQDNSVRTYNITIVVVNVTAADILSEFTIDGADVLIFEGIRVIFTVYNVNVIATPINPSASVRISGNQQLRTGNNTVTVIVTMPDNGPSYTFTRNVLVSSPCLLKGTKVKTPKGYIPIEQMKVGYPIIMHDGSITKVTKVGKWECNAYTDKNDLSKLMYKIPTGKYNCTSPLYISHFHRMFTPDEWLRFPKNLGFNVADVSELSTSGDGQYTIYNLAVENGKHLVVNGGCVVESWTSDSNSN